MSEYTRIAERARAEVDHSLCAHDHPLFSSHVYATPWPLRWSCIVCHVEYVWYIYPRNPQLPPFECCQIVNTQQGRML